MKLYRTNIFLSGWFGPARKDVDFMDAFSVPRAVDADQVTNDGIAGFCSACAGSD